MLQCIAIDDEPSALEVIQLLTADIPFLELRAVFRNPMEALEYMQHQQIDLLFLDINMPAISGINFYSILQHKPMVIFTTAYSEFAVKSYELNAIDYLLKPIEFSRLLKAVTKAQFHSKKIEQRQSEASGREIATSDAIFMRSGTELHQVIIQDIRFLKSDGNYVEIHLREKKLLVRSTLDQIIKLLPGEAFARIHRSFIVALSHIQIVKHDSIKITGEELPLSATYRADLVIRVEAGSRKP